MVQLPSVTVDKTASKQADVVVVGLASTSNGTALVGDVGDLDKSFARHTGSTVLALAEAVGAKPELGHTVVLANPDLRVVVVGLGEVDASPEQVRRATGSALRVAADLPDAPHTVAVTLDTADPEQVKGVTEGALLGAYVYGKVTGAPAAPRVSGIEVIVPSVRAEVKEAVKVAQVVAENVVLARDWVNTPANLLFPESFADRAREALKEAKVDVEVLDDKALEKAGFGGIMAVGGGSSRKPRLVRASYHPRGAKFHLALVGKGITFDAGGLNLKPAEGMYTMKSDMSGAAAVLAAVRAASQLGLQVQVTAYAAMAENLPSGTAYRPSDVLTMYGGTTVENVNSDAEGRLVMADALVRAGEDSPDMILDVATLTGACVVALGLRVAGLMASDDDTADVVLDAAELAGEDFWHLPIPEHLRKELDSKVADLKSGGPRQGGALTAAAFLQRFVPENTPWAHLDIAGPAFNEAAPYDYVPSGGTGHAVRTLVALAASLQG